MEKITVYHGTTRKRGESIIADKLINSDAKGDYDDNRGTASGVDLTTTKGFVYVTDDPAYAYYLAQKTAILFENEREYIYLFKLEIPLDNLEADLDDLRILSRLPDEEAKSYSAEMSLKKCQSARISGNVDLTTTEHSALLVPLHCNSSLDKETSSILRDARNARSVSKLSSRDFLDLLETL